MSTYMRSDSFKTTPSAKSTARSASGHASASGREPGDDIPDSPPTPLRGEYLKVSWAYVYWCAGMLIWSALCVVYFIMTRQTTNMFIGIALSALLVAMIVLPAMLFGGATWYKRLGWMMLLLAMFSAMWIYPFAVVSLGIKKRVAEGRYHHMTIDDLWHTALTGLTVIVSAWTLMVTWRCGRLVRRLYLGEFGVTDVKVRH
jgi:hypothetical protein